MDMLVSSALEADSSLPSFFEMFMTQQVEQSLKPAARHAHRCAASVCAFGKGHLLCNFMQQEFKSFPGCHCFQTAVGDGFCERATPLIVCGSGAKRMPGCCPQPL